MLHGIKRRSANAAARAHSTDDQRVDIQALQFRRERRPKEGAGVLLHDDRVRLSRLQTLDASIEPPRIAPLPNIEHLRLPPEQACVRHLGMRVLDFAPYDGHVSVARSGQQTSHRVRGCSAAGVGADVERGPRRPVGRADVDEEQRRAGAPAHLVREARGLVARGRGMVFMGWAGHCGMMGLDWGHNAE